MRGENENLWGPEVVENLSMVKVESLVGDETLLLQLVHFVCKYSIHAGDKGAIKKAVEKSQKTERRRSEEREEENKFLSYMDCLTASDLAFSCWNYVNCLPDWKHKKANPLDNYSHNAKWTRAMKGRGRRDQPEVGSEGWKLYTDLVKWFDYVKKHRRYGQISNRVNEYAKEIGLVRVYAAGEGVDEIEKGSKRRKRDVEDIEGGGEIVMMIPTFDFIDEDDDDDGGEEGVDYSVGSENEAGDGEEDDDDDDGGNDSDE